jgi:hypothetical protein
MPFLREKTPVKTVALGGAVLVLVAAVSAGATLLSRLERRIEAAVSRGSRRDSAGAVVRAYG